MALEHQQVLLPFHSIFSSGSEFSDCPEQEEREPSAPGDVGGCVQREGQHVPAKLENDEHLTQQGRQHQPHKTTNMAAVGPAIHSTTTDRDNKFNTLAGSRGYLKPYKSGIEVSWPGWCSTHSK